MGLDWSSSSEAIIGSGLTQVFVQSLFNNVKAQCTYKKERSQLINSHRIRVRLTVSFRVKVNLRFMVRVSFRVRVDFEL